MKIAVLGYGTVGSGVVEVLRENRSIIEERAGEPVEVKYVLDLREFPGDPVNKILVHEYDRITADPEIETIVETMGGVGAAYHFVKKALEQGIHVCTSNKELVEKHGAKLMGIAKEKQCNFFFEASVGGGIPIIRPLLQCITADYITEIKGILNGTTNYILTKMAVDAYDFKTVLKTAQELGYAESNPSADVEGFDAARKIAILASAAYGKQVDYEDILTEGITKVSDKDFVYAAAMKTAIKLLCRVSMINGKLHAIVAPHLVCEGEPLYGVTDVFNAIVVAGNMLGDVMFYGKGAGKLPTASAVVADVIETLHHRIADHPVFWTSEKQVMAPKEELLSSFFVRVPMQEHEKAKVSLPILKVIAAEGLEEEFACMTAPVSEAEFARIKSKLTILGYLRFA